MKNNAQSHLCTLRETQMFAVSDGLKHSHLPFRRRKEAFAAQQKTRKRPLGLIRSRFQFNQRDQ